MSWKPVHEAHAIDRVAVLIAFKGPISDKLLTRASASVVESHEKYGFNQKQRAETAFPNISPPSSSLPPGRMQDVEVPHNGWVLQRVEASEIVEDAGFRDGVFSYMSQDYGRWENLISRFSDVFGKALGAVLNSIDVSSVTLEYWDRFVFEGEPKEADVSTLLTGFDPIVPTANRQGSGVWHSHAGWFENADANLALINRNISLYDENVGKVEDGEELSDEKRFCNIYTVIELQINEQIEDFEKICEYLSNIHKRSLALFGETISPMQREKIGLDLEDYK